MALQALDIALQTMSRRHVKTVKNAWRRGRVTDAVENVNPFL